MKKLFYISIFMFCGLLFAGNVNAQSPGNSNGNGNNPNQQIGPGIPMQTVVKVLKVAAPFFGENLGTMVSGYNCGNCVVIEVTENVYRVSYGGGLILIDLTSGI